MGVFCVSRIGRAGAAAAEDGGMFCVSFPAWSGGEYVRAVLSDAAEGGAREGYIEREMMLTIDLPADVEKKSRSGGPGSGLSADEFLARFLRDQFSGKSFVSPPDERPHGVNWRRSCRGRHLFRTRLSAAKAFTTSAAKRRFWSTRTYCYGFAQTSEPRHGQATESVARLLESGEAVYFTFQNIVEFWNVAIGALRGREVLFRRDRHQRIPSRRRFFLDSLGVALEQQAPGDQRPCGGLYLLQKFFFRLVALFDRQTRVPVFFAFGFGAGEGNKRADHALNFIRRADFRIAQIPAGVSRKRHRDFR